MVAKREEVSSKNCIAVLKEETKIDELRNVIEDRCSCQLVARGLSRSRQKQARACLSSRASFLIIILHGKQWNPVNMASSGPNEFGHINGMESHFMACLFHITIKLQKKLSSI